MINYHPNNDMLIQHAKGCLSIAMATAVSAHCELCPQCQKSHSEMVQQQAEHTLISTDPTESSLDVSIELDDMLTTIMQLKPSTSAVQPLSIETVSIKGFEFDLPRAFRQQRKQSWKGFGKIHRMRFENDSPTERASLLHIAAGGEIPEHTHQGNEITLLLDGYFEDEYNCYGPGDFIILNANHQHKPKTCDGCLCYTVVDSPLHFTQGLSKLFNPIGNLIY
ncbi:ChrR family anti-sigma-E factor [Shewanella youngdeokensis]|uniref:ChrR family anti-sigma-E factor n=1 Tax=Shewanella youngdeokensis TaxID=2999068 RepID=A0ABZ0JVL9_9GAMM|nr:ChrR family anti-sigma-E factor [Shewanella sp. DAU334]